MQHAVSCQLMCKIILTLGFFPLCPGNALLHSPMLDLDSDVRPSPIGHLSQTASLKRGSSFQSGRDDGRHLFYWKKKSCSPHCPLYGVVKKTQTKTYIFWFFWIVRKFFLLIYHYCWLKNSSMFSASKEQFIKFKFKFTIWFLDSKVVKVFFSTKPDLFSCMHSHLLPTTFCLLNLLCVFAKMVLAFAPSVTSHIWLSWFTKPGKGNKMFD